MKISEIYSAMGLKVKLNYEDSSVKFKTGVLLRIEHTQEQQLFLVSQYGFGADDEKSVLCKAGSQTADYLLDLLSGERNNAYRCMFLIDGVENNHIVVQSYTFQSVTEYKTSINIVISDRMAESVSAEKLRKDYVWDQLGLPALFCLNYKDRKKKQANLRFVGGKRYLIAQNTVQGIIAESEAYLKERYDVPVDVFVAPQINFIPQSEVVAVNDAFETDLEKISNPASYFARWEAYDELSKKLLDAEREEFGELPYKSFKTWTELNGVTYEFEVGQELDDSFKDKEICVTEKESIEEQLDKNAKRKRQVGVGKIKKIVGNKVTTFLESDDNTEIIPYTGVLKLNTAGDRYIMARRLAARERMVKHQAPIKSIVALIESGVSGYELPNAWGNHKAVTEELRRNFRRANELNPEQIHALDIAINTPDIALIQGPPGTGKTTVIKAICERFREIFEANEKKLQKVDPEHILRSPKILISSFQNEAVDNAISAPLPGDIPAYRKIAKRSKESSKEQYQRALELWYSGLCDSINSMIEDETASKFIDIKRELDDEFLSYKNAGEPIDKATMLIDRYLGYVEIPYPKKLVESAKAIILAASASSDDDYSDPIVSKILAQRVSKETFADDGARNARKLAAYIRINDDLDIPSNILSAIEVVADDDYSEAEFEVYVEAMEVLRKKYCHQKLFIDPRDKDTINECILTLSNMFSDHYLSTLSSMESKKSLILSEFLNSLKQNYESVVKKYSMTTAATCQTCLDLREDSNKTFDLVVIDEAARANPLDLFIPMSMGRKIVLVGDHKQLPHMLEPDVLKMLMNDLRFRDIPEIEKSLFERLFEMFSNGQKPKAIPLTHQFRMHPDICSFVSDAFYDGILKTADSITVENRMSPEAINKGMALTFVNITIARGKETPGISKSRWAEVEIIGQDVRKIMDTTPDASIGIITFYATQSLLIKRHLDTILNDEEKYNIEVGTVDAFQGKEFDFVLLSCVRSNKPKDGSAPDVGFLEKPNRLCVAFSRSIRQLAVYGDAETLLQIPCFSKLYEICAIEGGGCYREY